MPGSSPGDVPMLGRYQLIREIARSNDVVWEGRDPEMNRRVAVKELALTASLAGQARRDRIDRFRREARAAGAMSHPNIVTIHEIGEDRGRYFIAMEFLEGQTLRERINMGGALPLSEVAAIADGLCDALIYAHERGIVHRDIKPDNIHILPGGRVKLTDFGIARITYEDQLTVAGQVFGTPSYMSPEQVLGRPIDGRSDEFSLAIVLFEMIAGAKPFTGDSVATITYRIVNDATPQLTGAPAALDTVLHRALAKAPDARYPTIAEFRAAFAAAAATRTGPQAQYVSRGPSPAMMPIGTQPLQEPPHDVSADLQRTAMYGAQTQYGVAPGNAANYANTAPLAQPTLAPHPSAATYTPAYAPPQDNTQRTVLIVLLSVMVLLAALLGGGYAITHAYKNFGAVSSTSAAEAQYAKAVQLYHFGDFEGAAEAFKQVRLQPQTDEALRNKAVQGEVFCYREMGHKAQAQNDMDGAARWYQAALTLSPNDSLARTELNAVQKAPNTSPSAPLALAPLAPAPSTPPPSPGVSTGSQFNNANAQNDALARPYLEAGKTADAQGSFDAAQKDYNQAIVAGPGSPSAIEAGRLLQISLTAHPQSNSLVQ